MVSHRSSKSTGSSLIVAIAHWQTKLLGYLCIIIKLLTQHCCLASECMSRDAARHYAIRYAITHAIACNSMCILVVTLGIVYQYACNIDACHCANFGYAIATAHTAAPRV
jgi:hypothetical protein